MVVYFNNYGDKLEGKKNMSLKSQLILMYYSLHYSIYIKLDSDFRVCDRMVNTPSFLTRCLLRI